ncbi:PEP-CTERM sorting domain-containing protein [Thiobacillus denitrificans]|uniref:PEP-CTERM sorting domain-containing protein n=1 Tax=Thiobacillus denitrificans TaxID=36861 RepID=UPI0012FA7E5B
MPTVPSPATLPLLGIGLAALVYTRRHRAELRPTDEKTGSLPGQCQPFPMKGVTNDPLLGKFEPMSIDHASGWDIAIE